MFSLHKKQRICRFYNEDIWGSLRVKQKLNRTFVLIIKSYREKRAPLSLFSKISVKKSRRRSPFGELLAVRKKLSYFYGGAKSTTVKTGGNEEQTLHKFYSVLLNWDTRLSSVLYRSSLVPSILEAFNLIFSGGVTVNREVICSPNYQLSTGEVVELVESRKLEHYTSFLKRLNSQPTPVVQPPYLEVSHTLFSVILIRKPGLRELHYPFVLTL
jgi:ribosomal protein S4